MNGCQLELKNAGKAYPRTCPTCGLTGACAKGLIQPPKRRNPDYVAGWNAAIEAAAEMLDAYVALSDDEIGSYLASDNTDDVRKGEADLTTKFLATRVRALKEEN